MIEDPCASRSDEHERSSETRGGVASPVIDVSLLARCTKHGAKRMKPEANRARSSDDRAAIADHFLKIETSARQIST